MIPFDPWCYSVAFDWFIDFCLWVLEADGLHASPFDFHRGGDHLLQSAGLEAESWHAWMRNMVMARDYRTYTLHHQWTQRANDLSRFWQQGEAEPEDTPDFCQALTQAFQELLPHARQRPFFPFDFWQGPVAVKRHLQERWQEYWQIPDRNPETGMLGSKVKSTTLRQDVEPYQTQLDGLMIHLVAYPQQIDYLFPPFSVLLTMVPGQFDAEQIRRRALRAAEALSRRNATTINTSDEQHSSDGSDDCLQTTIVALPGEERKEQTHAVTTPPVLPQQRGAFKLPTLLPSHIGILRIGLFQGPKNEETGLVLLTVTALTIVSEPVSRVKGMIVIQRLMGGSEEGTSAALFSIPIEMQKTSGYTESENLFQPEFVYKEELDYLFVPPGIYLVQGGGIGLKKNASGPLAFPQPRTYRVTGGAQILTGEEYYISRGPW